MERIAWQMMNLMPVREIARLNQKSIYTIRRICRAKEYMYVYERIKQTSFSRMDQRGRDGVDQAIKIFQNNAAETAQHIVDLVKKSGVPKSVQLAAGMYQLNKAGAVAPAIHTQENPLLDPRIIELDVETTRQVEHSPEGEENEPVPA